LAFLPIVQVAYIILILLACAIIALKQDQKSVVALIFTSKYPKSLFSANERVKVLVYDGFVFFTLAISQKMVKRGEITEQSLRAQQLAKQHVVKLRDTKNSNKGIMDKMLEASQHPYSKTELALAAQNVRMPSIVKNLLMTNQYLGTTNFCKLAQKFLRSFRVSASCRLQPDSLQVDAYSL
jgi:hypothetical protein